MNELPEYFDAHLRAGDLAARYPGIAALCSDLILELAEEGDERARTVVRLAAAEVVNGVLTRMLLNIPEIDDDPDLRREVIRQANRYRYRGHARRVLDELSREAP